MKSAVLTFAAATLALLGSAGAVAAQESGWLFGWIHGDWALKVGATGMVAPDFEGSKKYMFSASPIISLGKAGPEARFTSLRQRRSPSGSPNRKSAEHAPRASAIQSRLGA